MIRAVLISPDREQPLQAFPPNLKSARAWAKKVLTHKDARVELFEQSEKLVEVLKLHE